MINFNALYTISDEVTFAILVYRNNEMCDCHIGTTDQSSRTSSLSLCKHTLLFQETNIAAGHVRENTVLILEKQPVQRRVNSLNRLLRSNANWLYQFHFVRRVGTVGFRFCFKIGYNERVPYLRKS